MIPIASLSSVSAFDQDRSIEIISAYAQAGAVGYVHVYANAFSKTVLLDINVEDSFSAPTDGSTVAAANTNGLRKITGMTCKINGDVIQI